ncbi:hypothetical protein [Actinoplanes sp. DH11]|uniref:hypothetical protein n=1 Tax=Actinoplanes sp. DH11 TaxID=2857011 RepID=UPI001E4CCEF5|nr:hypothetical protein [Actinoplanes sp. DH11]
MTVQSSQVVVVARRIMSAFLWLALVVIVALAAVNSWTAFHSGDHSIAIAASVAGLAPILLAVLLTRRV